MYWLGILNDVRYWHVKHFFNERRILVLRGNMISLPVNGNVPYLQHEMFHCVCTSSLGAHSANVTESIAIVSDDVRHRAVSLICKQAVGLNSTHLLERPNVARLSEEGWAGIYIGWILFAWSQYMIRWIVSQIPLRYMQVIFIHIPCVISAVWRFAFIRRALALFQETIIVAVQIKHPFVVCVPNIKK